jgi:hypothetical protein
VEVEEHRLAVGGQQHVGRLEIEVHDAVVVRELKRVARHAAIQHIAWTYETLASICRAAPAMAGKVAGSARAAGDESRI